MHPIDNKTVDKLASQCVKCALCLPFCPTYQVTEDENESPRGRIALFQAISQAKLELTPKVEQHLDLCLGCRACEAVCPAHVKYGELLTRGRAYNATLKKPSMRFKTRFLMAVLQHRFLKRLLHYALWFLEVSKLRFLAKWFSMAELESLLPPVKRPQTLLPFYPAKNDKRGSVLLFTDCTSSFCDTDTLLASVFVLTSFGFDVHVPPKQTCCGAMALHAGLPNQAKKLDDQNKEAFSGSIEHVVTLATGCSSVLQDAEYLKNKKVIDIFDFIAKQPWPASLSLQPIPEQVLLHTPCTRRNVLKSTSTPYDILSRIPELQVSSFQTTSCCGAAGTYMLEHPKMAKTLVNKLLDDIHEPLPHCIATTNIGCLLHIQRELQTRHLALRATHPVMLLARAMNF